MRFATADIRTPEDFQAMARHLRPDDFANRVLISPDPEEHTAYIQRFIDLGFDDIYLHQVGRDQQAFLRMAGARILPALRSRTTRASVGGAQDAAIQDGVPDGDRQHNETAAATRSTATHATATHGTGQEKGRRH
jgi:hypothetical protein